MLYAELFSGTSSEFLGRTGGKSKEMPLHIYCGEISGGKNLLFIPKCLA